jgi:hypothetical protein
MAEFLSVHVDIEEVERMLRAGDRIYQSASAAALNKAARWVRTRLVRQVSKEARIAPQRLVRRRVKIRRATRKRLEATIGALVRPIPAIQLSRVRQTASGVSASRGWSWRSAFIQRTKFGNTMVLRRRGRSRYPLDGIKVPVQGVIEEALPRWADAAVERISAELAREIAWRMDRATR